MLFQLCSLFLALFTFLSTELFFCIFVSKWMCNIFFPFAVPVLLTFLPTAQHRTTSSAPSTIMQLFLVLKKLVGFNVHQTSIPVDIDRTKQVREFFDTRGAAGSRFRLEHKNDKLQAALKENERRRQRHDNSAKDKKSIAATAKKKRVSKVKALEDLEAKVSAAKAEADAAKRNEDEAETELDAETVALAEIEEEGRKIMQDLVEVENNLVILGKLEECENNPKNRDNKLPLGPGSDPEDMRRAVSEFVPSFQALCSDCDCPRGNS